jgi:hypothetical protein
MGGVLNVVKAGRTVPLRFEVFAGTTELTSTAAVKSLTIARISCASGRPAHAIETVAGGRTGIRYEHGSFVYNWKTPRQRGTCLSVTVTTQDGSTLSALFTLT